MNRSLAPMVVLALAGLAHAASPFDGTWRPDPQRPPASQSPDEISLEHGIYKCSTCKPPYEIKADGTDQKIEGNSYYDVLNIVVVDDHSIRKIGKKAGRPVIESVATVSSDGKTLVEARSIHGMGPNVIEVTSRSSRVASGPPGSHAISGGWKLLENDLTNHDEDTRFTIKDGALSMTDKMGRSFTAKFDGTDAPYTGDPEFDAVSLKMIDDHAIEEYDKKAGKVVKISRWRIDPDGQTMHVEFDDTHGHVQHQDGRRIEGGGQSP